MHLGHAVQRALVLELGLRRQRLQASDLRIALHSGSRHEKLSTAAKRAGQARLVPRGESETGSAAPPLCSRRFEHEKRAWGGREGGHEGGREVMREGGRS